MCYVIEQVLHCCMPGSRSACASALSCLKSEPAWGQYGSPLGHSVDLLPSSIKFTSTTIFKPIQTSSLVMFELISIPMAKCSQETLYQRHASMDRM